MLIIILLPTQLFENSPILKDITKNDIIVLYEHPLYFNKFTYHNMKLVMHRATMKLYFDYLQNNYDNKIEYINFYEKIDKKVNFNKFDLLKVYNPTDHDIMKEYNNISKKYKIQNEIIDNPSFICTFSDYKEYLDQSEIKNPFNHHSFYIWARRKYNILMNGDKPIGGNWSFDKENRLPFPKDYTKDIKFKNNNNKYILEAKKYINKYFSDNQGNDEYYLPIDFKGSKKHFKKFMKERLNDFGPYEDAMNKKIIFGNHSVMSPIINIGLITPIYIINEIQNYYKKNKKIKIESVEGYIRQLFWREFCVLVYLFKDKELEETNFFKHKNKLSDEWYNGSTNFDIMNDLIHKALKYGWLHHIERLMYIGNFMLITKTDPIYVYKWFMEMFIDAYPWVMKPNVYGMSQFSTGPLMMKRPYFSSSNYIDKMSNYKRKSNILNKIKINGEEYEWYEIWDCLFYNFINSNYKYLSKNYSTANIANVWRKKNKVDQDKILKISNYYFKNYKK